MEEVGSVPFTLSASTCMISGSGGARLWPAPVILGATLLLNLAPHSQSWQPVNGPASCLILLTRNPSS